MISKESKIELNKLKSFPKLFLSQLPRFIIDPILFSNLAFALMIIKKLLLNCALLVTLKLAVFHSAITRKYGAEK